MKVKYEQNKNAMRELRTGPAARALVTRAAGAISAAAGPHDYTTYPADVTGGRGRARAAVVAGSIEARLDQARNGSLQRALGTVRI